jgi:hypothetical protein
MLEKVFYICGTLLLVLILNFEFRAVRELERTHFGIYCFLSFDINRQSFKDSPGYFDTEFSSIFISSEQIEEIRDQITDMLEREDESNETESTDSFSFTDPSADS